MWLLMQDNVYDERTLTYEAIVLEHFRPAGKFFFSRDLFADVMGVHNRNMKHVLAIEFDYTNLLAML